MVAIAPCFGELSRDLQPFEVSVQPFIVGAHGACICLRLSPRTVQCMVNSLKLSVEIVVEFSLEVFGLARVDL